MSRLGRRATQPVIVAHGSFSTDASADVSVSTTASVTATATRSDTGGVSTSTTATVTATAARSDSGDVSVTTTVTVTATASATDPVLRLPLIVVTNSGAAYRARLRVDPVTVTSPPVASALTGDTTMVTTSTVTATGARTDTGAVTASTTVSVTATADVSGVGSATPTTTVNVTATAARSDTGQVTATTTSAVTATAMLGTGQVTASTTVQVTAVAAVSVQAWRLVMPIISESHTVRGSLQVKSHRSVTVFGDDSELFVSELGYAAEGGDEWHSIPTDVKYLWLGGHENITTDPVVRDLWLAHTHLGITVEAVNV